MLRMALIVPKDLILTANMAIDELNEDVTILEGSLGNGVQIAKRLEKEGYDVIIARGGTQLLLKRSGIQIPTVAIPITPIDIFKAIREAEAIDNNIAIMAFNNMMPASESYEEIAGRNMKIYQVKDEAEVEERIKEIAKAGYKVLVGGGIITRYAPRYNLKAIVIKTGKEALMSAIQEAKRIAIATKLEKESGERFKAIVEYAYDGIISVDREGYINIFNYSAEKLLKIEGKKALGKYVNNIVPEIELEDTLYSGIEETDVIKSINGNKLILSKIPIKVGKEIVDAVAIFQDINKIQQMEEKIRREIAATGHFARYTFSDILGHSKEIKESIRIGKEYAKVSSTILIEGETGTGKEVMAQSIHNYSLRANSTFVAVNCAALPESLLESELFGYAPGAFTGADRKGKRGVFELAHGGTIFLDEISEMNPLLQGRLLRVLQEKQIMRIGDNKLIPIDVRIIVATNKNLFGLVREGKFREDLYYRLNVLKIKLPPLRERKGDIPSLIEGFIHEYSKKLSRETITLTREAIEYLCQYNWPGNVRELKNFVERLMVITKKTKIVLEDIKGTMLNLEGLELDNYYNDNSVEYAFQSQSSHKTINLIDAEKINIEEALRESEGCINEAAERLGISRTTLWRKMKKYTINVAK